MKGFQADDPEIQCTLLSDLQIGHLTPTYNVERFKERLTNYKKGLLVIADLHRLARPIRKLVVLKGGDDIQGENIGRQVNLDELEKVAFDQIYDVALPELTTCFTDLSYEYEEIELYGVRGNHGKLSRWNANRSNWDNVVNKGLEDRLAKRPNIKCHFEYRSFYQLVNINGFKIFLFHGDQVTTYQGIPYYGILRRIGAWYISLGPFDMACYCHFHNPTHNLYNRIWVLGNGAFPSDDEWALEKLGQASIPMQWTFGLHRKFGLVWPYAVYLDNNPFTKQP